MHCCTQCPQPCSRPPPTHASPETPGHSWASLGQSLVGSVLLSPGSWCPQGFVPFKSLFPQSGVSSAGSMVGLMATSFRTSHDALLHSVPPALQQAPAHPRLPRDPWALLGKSGSVSCGVTAPFSWVLVPTRLCLCPSRLCFLSLV